MCDKIVDAFWQKDKAVDLKKRIKVLSLGFRYAGLMVNLDKDSWITLERYQKSLFPFTKTIQ